MSYGLDIKNKKDLVGICYSTWFNPIVSENGPKPKNIAEILAGKDTWGNIGQFHLTLRLHILSCRLFQRIFAAVPGSISALCADPRVLLKT